MSKAYCMYPDFKSVTIEDKDVFSEITKKFDSYSDFNLLSLLSWDADGVNTFSILNYNLVIKIKDYLGDNFLYSVLGNNQPDQTLSRLIKDVGILSFVPEVVVSSLIDTSGLNIVEDRDNFDYIMDCEKIAKLEGGSFRHLREDVHKFQRLYPNYYTKEIDINDFQVKSRVLEIAQNWYNYKNFDKAKQEEEYKIKEKFFKYYGFFNGLSVGLFVDDQLMGCIFSEIISKDLVISHYGFSDNKYSYCDYMLKYETAKYLYEHGYKYQNQEQDTGLLGLRTAKMFYNPVGFLKKYTISN